VSGDLAWESRREVAERNAALWDKMEWFSPLWIPMGEFHRPLQETADCSKERAIELFDYHTSTIYTIPFQAVCVTQIMPQAHSLREFSPIAREAFLAFYSGYRASSIAALIPAIEGNLTRIVSGVRTELSISAKIDRQDERVFTFETFRRWLQSSFFRNTAEYDGVTWLNRHLSAHGTASSWQQSANFNFRRLVVALATLGVIESWHDESHRVLCFSPR
jgi:hypothetical protein